MLAILQMSVIDFISVTCYYCIVMWELSKLTSRGGDSTRRIFTYALTAILAAFLWTLLFAPTTHAADTASWTGDTIIYSKGQYFSAGKAKAGDSVNLPVDSSYYTRIETVTERPLLQKAHVIYFAPGQDPGTATTAAYADYDFKDKTFSNPKNITTISITTQSASTNSYSSCSADIGSLGWIICPVSIFLAKGMDWILGVISDLMGVQPATVGNANNTLYIAWNLMRTFANIAFIIVFLIIIYSQLSNLGVSNYGIKKLLPRLIIGAVLVNLSYYICAIAIDLSNVIGYSMQGFFDGLRENVFNITNDTWNQSGQFSVQSWVEFALSGGSAAIAGGAGLLIATGGSIASAIFLLLPVLVGLMLAVLVAFLILAARQVIITVLLIISPLAFVAYLLPNTEKWFTKWRELFMTMLVFFPAFAIVFAGAQLAGGIIIQNATSMNIVILGLIVQLAPLAISPLLMKLSGNFLGKIASLANTPNKLIKDRTKAWSNERAEMYRKKALSTQARRFTPRGIAQGFDSRARRVKERSELYDKMADNRHLASHSGGKYNNHALHEMKHAAETEHKRLEELMERDLQVKIRMSPDMLKKEMDVRTLSDEVATAKAMLDKTHEDLRAGKDTSAGKVLADLLVRSETATRDLALTAIATQTAKRVQQDNLSKALLENSLRVEGELVRDYAGGIDTSYGSDSALTFAITQQREAQAKIINERTQLIKHFELDGGGRQTLAEGKNIVATKGGVQYEFIGSDDYAREAAIELQLKTGSFAEIESIIALSGIPDGVVDSRGRVGARKFAQTIGDATYSNGLGNKAHYLSGQFINDIASGRVGGEAGLNDGVTLGIMEGKFKPEELANNDPGAIRRYIQVARNALNGQFEPRVRTEADRKRMLANIELLKTYASQIIDPTIDVGNNASGSTKTILEELSKLQP